MKLSTAIESGVVKDGDEVEVSFKMTYRGQSCVNKENSLFSIHPEVGNYIFSPKATRLIEITENPKNLVGKKLKLLDAGKYLKLGMNVIVFDSFGKEQNRGVVVSINSNPSRFLVNENGEYDFWFLGNNDGWTVEILSEPTVKESLTVENSLSQERISKLEKDLNALKDRLGKEEAELTQIKMAHLPLRVNKLEQYSKNHEEKIDVLEDQVNYIMQCAVFNTFATRLFNQKREERGEGKIP